MQSKIRKKSNFRISAMTFSQLTKHMNAYHHRAEKSMRSFLGYAKKSGDALRRAKKKLGKRGKWVQWVKDHFDGKYTTAAIYMRVSREWYSPKFMEARDNGSVSSLATFLSFTRKAQAFQALGPDAMALTEDQELRKDILDVLKIRLKKVDRKLLDVFDENIEDIWDLVMKEVRRYAEDDLEDESEAEQSFRWPPMDDDPWEGMFSMNKKAVDAA